MNIVDPVYIGSGFEWEQSHSQAVREIEGRDKRHINPPKFYKRLRQMVGMASNRNIHGSAWIHGLGRDVERNQFMDADDLYSHIGIFGTTGAGKGRIIEPYIEQAIDRGDAVIILDPKWDEGMVNRAYGELKRRGRPEDFLLFAPAFPRHSVRINPFQNFSAGTQLASRSTSLLPPGDGGNFTAFAWKAINNVVQGMILAGEAPSIKAIRYIVGGQAQMHDLFVRAFVRFMRPREQKFPGWEEGVRNTQSGLKGKDRVPGMGHLVFYENEVRPHEISEPLEGIREVIRHPSEHYTKMISNIGPSLTALSTEDIAALLSPDYDDYDDPRPLVNLKQIVRKGQVLYVALNSLGDFQTADWIGSLLLADMTTVVADRYNHGEADRGVTLIVDEIAEVANKAFVKFLNKSRGAKIRTIWSTQVIADLSVRFSSDDEATQILGNVNTLYAGRLKDQDTKEYMSRKLGTTRVTSVAENHSSSTKVDGLVDFNRGTGSRFDHRDGESRVPPEVFDNLPDLHFFASLHDSRKLKLRVPYMPIEKGLEWPRVPYGE